MKIKDLGTTLLRNATDVPVESNLWRHDLTGVMLSCFLLVRSLFSSRLLFIWIFRTDSQLRNIWSHYASLFPQFTHFCFSAKILNPAIWKFSIGKWTHVGCWNFLVMKTLLLYWDLWIWSVYFHWKKEENFAHTTGGGEKWEDKKKRGKGHHICFRFKCHFEHFSDSAWSKCTRKLPPPLNKTTRSVTMKNYLQWHLHNEVYDQVVYLPEEKLLQIKTFRIASLSSETLSHRLFTTCFFCCLLISFQFEQEGSVAPSLPLCWS